MLALLLALSAQSFTCPGASFLAHGVPPTGEAACYVDTATGVVLISRHRLLCRRGTQPVVQLDGRTAACRRIGADA